MKRPVDFKISALPLDPFRFLFRLTEKELLVRGARKVSADTKPGFPCRVSLQEAEIGEVLILLQYMHHDVPGPYRSAGPIYVRESAKEADLGVNELPEVVEMRLMSLRGYDSEGLMVASDVVEQSENLRSRIVEFFADENVAYLHLHNAKPGCYSCRVDRA